MEQAPIVAYAFDASGVVTFAQGRGLELSGLAPPKLLGRSIFDLFAERPDIVDAARRACDGERVHIQVEAFDRTWEVHCERRDGVDGSSAEVIGVATDISVLARADHALQALEASEERFRALVANSSDMIGVFDADGTLIYVSDAVTHFSADAAKTFIGTHGFDQVIAEDLPRIAELKAELIRQPGRVVTTQFHFMHPDGTIHVAESTGRNALDNPAVRGVVVNTRDVTDKARAEALLQAQVRILAMIASGAALEDTVAAIVGEVEARLPGTRCAIEVLVHGDTLGGKSANALKVRSSAMGDRGIDPLRTNHGAGSAPKFPESQVGRLQATGRLLVVPIESGQRPVGTITVVPPASQAYGADDVSFVRALANMVALAAERARVQDQLRLSVEALHKSAEDRERLLTHVVQAQEEERRRIADDIHDDSVQVMTAVALRLATLRRRLDEKELDPLLVNLEHDVQQSITRLRHLMFELHPPALENQGIAAALEAFLAIVTEEAGLSYSVEDRLSITLNTETRIVVYRIAQEAVANVCKHAQASRIEATLEESDGGVLVTIRDDGIGFEPEQPPQTQPWHLGLMVMRERAEQSGGWCVVESHPGSGTTVRYCVRYHAPESPALADPKAEATIIPTRGPGRACHEDGT